VPQIKTLPLDRAEGAQFFPLFRRLDSLCCEFESQSTAKVEDRGNDGVGGFVPSDAIDDRAVDLDAVDRKRLDVCQTCMPGAEVVDRDFDACILDGQQGFPDQLFVGDRHAFRDLDLQKVRGNPVDLKGVG